MHFLSQVHIHYFKTMNMEQQRRKMWKLSLEMLGILENKLCFSSFIILLWKFFEEMHFQKWFLRFLPH
jgi:hypothetical protein